MNRNRVLRANGGYQFLESLGGAIPSPRLPGPVIHQVGNRVQRILRMHRQIGALEQELAQQSIGVHATALPGTVRITEKHLHVRGLGEFLVPRHLPALVVDERFAQGCSHRIELDRERHQRALRHAVGHLAQQHQARSALDQHTDRRLVPPFDQITLPVSGHHAVGDLGRTHMNAHHVRNLLSPILTGRMRPALALAQQGNELAAQLAVRVGVGGAAGRLVRDMSGGVVGMHTSECAGNLLRQPAPTEQRANRLPQSAVGMQLRQEPNIDTALETRTVGATVAPQFAAQGAETASHPSSHDPKAPALLMQRTQRHALFGWQLCVSCSHLCNLPQVRVLHFGVEIAHARCGQKMGGYLPQSTGGVGAGHAPCRAGA